MTLVLPDAGQSLRRTDLAWLALFCMLLFGYAMFGGRPLTLHEARLPECSREMLASHDWLIPRSGGRPWLERPPLPHWITIATSLVLGQRVDSVWVVRLPSAIMGTIIVLLTAWTGGKFFGRWIGIASGLLLATMFEFHAYSTLAEDDIYLAALVAAAMACFVKAEFFQEYPIRETWYGGRPWSVVGFFLFLGLTNLVKGPLMGAILVASAVGPFLLLRGWLNRQWQPLRRFLWLWGILLFVALTIFWPTEVARQFPDVLNNWSFDYADTKQYDESVGYYFWTILWVIAPATPLALAAIWEMAYPKTRRPSRLTPAELFMLCWTLLPLCVLSIPHRKHHHYLLPILAPWGIFAALGAAFILPKLIKGEDAPRRGARLGFTVIAILAIGYCVGTTLLAAKSDKTMEDTAFLYRVRNEVPADVPLLINASSRSDKNGVELDFFRIQFYLRPDARLLHNLTFLREPDLHARTIYLITRASDERQLQRLGKVDMIDQSTKSRGETTTQPIPGDRFTLFRLALRPDLETYSCTQPINTLQAMAREKGPWCGPPFEAVTPTTSPATQPTK